MAQKLDYYQKLAKQMLEADRQRDQAFLAYEQMDRCEWQLPAAIKNLGWVKEVKSTDPHDAITAGVRVLATLDDRITIQPLDTTGVGKRKANEWERNLRWQMLSTNRRRQGKVQKDVVRSALVYDEVVAQVVDLDHQVVGMEMLKGKSARYKMARRYGRFLVNIYNPRHVHVRYSSSMPEAVLLCQKRKAQEIMDDWGDLAKGLKKYADDDLAVEYYDYCDWEVRAVWVGAEGEDVVIVKPMEHELGFLPWIAVIGGNTLEEEGAHRRQPLLYSVYTSDQYNTQNIVKSLYVSEVVAHSAAPRAKEEGPNPDETDINYGDPTRSAKVPPGNVYTPIPAPAIDQALMQVDGLLSQAIDKSTVSRVLLGGETGAESFAALNLVTQTAIGSLKPAKDLAEKALAEIYAHMLFWVNESSQPLIAYGVDKADQGMQYKIDPEEIDPTGLYLTVSLRPDVPTDQVQKLNAGILAKQIGISNETIMEDLGITDPQEEWSNFWTEKWIEQMINMDMASMQREMEMMQQSQFQQMQMAQEQQMQQEQMMQQEQQMQQEQMMMANQAQAPGMPGGVIGGTGWDPNMGGTPPALAYPQGTREMQTGESAGGIPIANMEAGGL